MTCLAPEEVDIVNGRIAEPTKVTCLSVSTSRERVHGDRECLGVFVVHHVLWQACARTRVKARRAVSAHASCLVALPPLGELRGVASAPRLAVSRHHHDMMSYLEHLLSRAAAPHFGVIRMPRLRPGRGRVSCS